MADFHQNGVVATLHDFSRRPVEALEADLRGFAARRPMALVLPALYSELERPALADRLVFVVASEPGAAVRGLLRTSGAPRTERPVNAAWLLGLAGRTE